MPRSAETRIPVSGGRITRKSVHEVVAKYAKAAGIEGVRCSPHTLRHTGAKRFILAGVSHEGLDPVPSTPGGDSFDVG